MMTRSLAAALVFSMTLAVGAFAGTPQWTPERWQEEDTLKLCTTAPDDSMYCFPVWLVVIDGDVFVRLGSKATKRMHSNTTGSILPVEVGGQRFERVRATEAPDYKERVAKAMADKYTSDLLVRFFSHPLTLRLKPEGGTSATP